MLNVDEPLLLVAHAEPHRHLVYSRLAITHAFESFNIVESVHDHDGIAVKLLKSGNIVIDTKNCGTAPNRKDGNENEFEDHPLIRIHTPLVLKDGRIFNSRQELWVEDTMLGSLTLSLSKPHQGQGEGNKPWFARLGKETMHDWKNCNPALILCYWMKHSSLATSLELKDMSEQQLARKENLSFKFARNAALHLESREQPLTGGQNLSLQRMLLLMYMYLTCIQQSESPPQELFSALICEFAPGESLQMLSTARAASGGRSPMENLNLGHSASAARFNKNLTIDTCYVAAHAINAYSCWRVGYRTLFDDMYQFVNDVRRRRDDEALGYEPDCKSDSDHHCYSKMSSCRYCINGIGRINMLELIQRATDTCKEPMDDLIVSNAIAEMRLANGRLWGPDLAFCSDYDHAPESLIVNETVAHLLLLLQSLTLRRKDMHSKGMSCLFQALVYILQSKSGSQGDLSTALPQDRKGLKECIFNWSYISWCSDTLECSANVENFFRWGRDPSIDFRRVIVSQVCLIHLRLCAMAELINNEEKMAIESNPYLLFETCVESRLSLNESIPELKKYGSLFRRRENKMTERDFLTLAVECDLTWDKSWQALHDHLGSDEEAVEIQGMGSLTKANIRRLLAELQREESD